MQISDEGLRLVKSFEGFHTRLKDGSCAAYLCPASVPTIGWGCTEGVRLGMVWTEAEAEAGLRREMAKFESAVNRLVTVSINTNERDALISLAYNIGVSGFQRSSVLKRLNNGDRKGAAHAFGMWTKANVKGRKIDLPGLVSRRKREAALFLKPVEAPEEPFMPQAVAEVQEVSKPAVAVSTGAAVIAVTEVVPSLIPPAVPQAVTDSLSNMGAWRGVGETVWTFKDWAVAQPTMASALTIGVATFWVWSRKRGAT